MRGTPPLLHVLRGGPLPTNPRIVARVVSDAEQHGLAAVLERSLRGSGVVLPPEQARRLND